jgi:hypothetical protein
VICHAKRQPEAAIEAEIEAAIETARMQLRIKIPRGAGYEWRCHKSTISNGELSLDYA